MFTFFYCFDKNYNVQAAVSILSLLDKVSEKINICIIHKDKDTFSQYEEKIIKHENIENLSLNSLDTKGLEFPNVLNKHISEATYYRMYLDQINFNFEITKSVYLDSDIICINNPITYFENIYSKLKKNKKPLAARTERVKHGLEQEDDNVFKRNNLSSINYFNAGVLLFDYEDWLKEDYFQNLREIQKNYAGTLEYWDQDLLNILVNGNYIEMNNFSNYHIAADWNHPAHITEALALFIHFQGKPKPWEISYLHDSSSKFFQDNYKKIFGRKVYISKSNFSRDLKGLTKMIFKLNILKTPFPFTTLKEAAKIFISYLKFNPSK